MHVTRNDEISLNDLQHSRHEDLKTTTLRFCPPNTITVIFEVAVISLYTTQRSYHNDILHHNHVGCNSLFHISKELVFSLRG